MPRKMKKPKINRKHPRVVKLSGGRSSGMMLLRLLEDGELKAGRGDVIVFNNTSAEHSKTYDFVKKIKSLAEKEYGIPFFWIEFCTYEDMGPSGFYQRHQTYRLVNHRPYSQKNPNGYRRNGEVFEEMISHSGFLPSTLARSCTKAMKIFTTNAFLSDWWGGGPAVPRQGHFHSVSKITDDALVKFHKLNNGSTPADVLLRKKRFVRSCPLAREEQAWGEYTQGEVREGFDKLKAHIVGGKAQLYGDYALEYYSYLGLRHKEEYRYERIKDRISNADESQSHSFSSQPVGEHVLVPLIYEKQEKDDVIEFWQDRKSEMKLDLGTSDSGLFSNCVFCPLKGKRKLELLARKTKRNTSRTSPASINWWVNIEQKYQRNLAEEGREPTKNGTRYVGFFGPSPEPVFGRMASVSSKPFVEAGVALQGDELELDVPCDCTD